MSSDGKIIRIVITGGPGGGKTSALPVLAAELSARGFGVVPVPETATELISAGLTRETLGSQYAFQSLLMKKQLEKEKLALTEAENLVKKEGRTAVIIFDRGLQDSRGYIPQSDFEKVLEKNGITEARSRDGYDAVFFLRSPAVDLPQSYTVLNNEARTESPEEAALTDRVTFDAWRGCPVFSEIGNETGFDGKICRLVRLVLEYVNG